MTETSPYPHADLASAGESVARGWTLLVATVASLALPVLHLTRDNDDDYAEDVGNPASLLSTIPRVIFRSVDDFQRVEPGMLGLKLILLRISLLVVLACLLLAAGIAVRWLRTGRVDAVPGWVRALTGLILVGSAVAAALLCGQIDSPDSREGLSLGVDAGSGLLLVLLCGAILLTAEVAPRWDIAQRHP
jgi:hypothetical protein